MAISSEGLPLISTSHFDPTFERPVEVRVKLNSTILDPGKHSAVIFKENFAPVINHSVKMGNVGYSAMGYSTSKGRGSIFKGISVRKGRNLIKTIKHRGAGFKSVKIVRFPLSKR